MLTGKGRPTNNCISSCSATPTVRKKTNTFSIFFLLRMQSICDRIWENPPYCYFREIEIALYSSSTTFELTLLQVRDRSPAPFPGYGALCPTTRELLNSRNYGLKALLCARIRSPYTTSARKSHVGGAF